MVSILNKETTTSTESVHCTEYIFAFNQSMSLASYRVNKELERDGDWCI